MILRRKVKIKEGMCSLGEGVFSKREECFFLQGERGSGEGRNTFFQSCLGVVNLP
jgi:hypothetical protein